MTAENPEKTVSLETSLSSVLNDFHLVLEGDFERLDDDLLFVASHLHMKGDCLSDEQKESVISRLKTFRPPETNMIAVLARMIRLLGSLRIPLDSLPGYKDIEAYEEEEITAAILEATIKLNARQEE